MYIASLIIYFLFDLVGILINEINCRLDTSKFSRYKKYISVP